MKFIHQKETIQAITNPLCGFFSLFAIRCNIMLSNNRNSYIFQPQQQIRQQQQQQQQQRLLRRKRKQQQQIRLIQLWNISCFLTSATTITTTIRTVSSFHVTAIPPSTIIGTKQLNKIFITTTRRLHGTNLNSSFVTNVATVNNDNQSLSFCIASVAFQQHVHNVIQISSNEQTKTTTTTTSIEEKVYRDDRNSMWLFRPFPNKHNQLYSFLGRNSHHSDMDCFSNASNNNNNDDGIFSSFYNGQRVQVRRIGFDNVVNHKLTTTTISNNPNMKKNGGGTVVRRRKGYLSYRLDLAYCGDYFCGWQRQEAKNNTSIGITNTSSRDQSLLLVPSVQQVIEDTILKGLLDIVNNTTTTTTTTKSASVIKHTKNKQQPVGLSSIDVRVSGRTDSGVHAIGQIARVRIPSIVVHQILQHYHNEQQHQQQQQLATRSSPDVVGNKRRIDNIVDMYDCSNVVYDSHNDDDDIVRQYLINILDQAADDAKITSSPVDSIMYINERNNHHHVDDSLATCYQKQQHQQQHHIDNKFDSYSNYYRYKWKCLSVTKVNNEFHPTFDTVSRSYVYLLDAKSIYQTLLTSFSSISSTTNSNNTHNNNNNRTIDYTMFVHEYLPLLAKKINQLLFPLVGIELDYYSYSYGKIKTQTTLCHLQRAHCQLLLYNHHQTNSNNSNDTKENDEIDNDDDSVVVLAMEFTANRFLRRMVRILVSTTLFYAMKQIQISSLLSLNMVPSINQQQQQLILDTNNDTVLINICQTRNRQLVCKPAPANGLLFVHALMKDEKVVIS